MDSAAKALLSLDEISVSSLEDTLIVTAIEEVSVEPISVVSVSGTEIPEKYPVSLEPISVASLAVAVADIDTDSELDMLVVSVLTRLMLVLDASLDPISVESEALFGRVPVITTADDSVDDIVVASVPGNTRLVLLCSADEISVESLPDLAIVPNATASVEDICVESVALKLTCPNVTDSLDEIWVASERVSPTLRAVVSEELIFVESEPLIDILPETWMLDDSDESI
jgi:hypothetical protein